MSVSDSTLPPLAAKVVLQCTFNLHVNGFSALAASTARINGPRLVFWCPFGCLVDVEVCIRLQVSQRRSIQAIVHNTLGRVSKPEVLAPVLLLKEYSQQDIRVKIAISSWRHLHASAFHNAAQNLIRRA